MRSHRVFRKPDDADLDALGAHPEIPADHLVRKLRSALCAVDLAFLKDLHDDHGGVPYEPFHVLGPILYGMTEGVRSGEQLQEHCRYDQRYRFLSDGQTPDDRTFQRAIKRWGGELEVLLRAVLRAARRLHPGLGTEVCVDGAKVSGCSSVWTYRQGASDLSDPDVRAMASHGRRYLGYNVQMASDPATGLVLGSAVVRDQADWHAMPAAVEAMETQFGEAPAHVIADLGYESPGNVQYLEDKGIDSVIRPSSDLPECLGENGDGELVCPAGKPLVFRHKALKRLRVYDVYRPEGGCRGCPLRDRCSFKSKRLDVPEGSDPGARFRNRDRFYSGTHEGAMRKRRLAELPFAALRRRTRFDRFERRGLGNVRLELLLWTIAYDLQLILKGVLSAVGRLSNMIRTIRRTVNAIRLHVAQAAHPLPRSIPIAGP